MFKYMGDVGFYYNQNINFRVNILQFYSIESPLINEMSDKIAFRLREI